MLLLWRPHRGCCDPPRPPGRSTCHYATAGAVDAGSAAWIPQVLVAAVGVCQRMVAKVLGQVAQRLHALPLVDACGRGRVMFARWHASRGGRVNKDGITARLVCPVCEDGSALTRGRLLRPLCRQPGMWCCWSLVAVSV